MVSVIIPTQNRKAMVAEAIRSVLSQTYKELECLVIDDASWDGTGAFISSHFPSVRYFFLPFPSGPARARNVGILKAQGEYLAFLDSDDAFLPEKIEKQLHFMKSNNFSVSQTYEIWYRRGKRVQPLKKHLPQGGEVFPHALKYVVISSSSVMLHRSVIEKCGLFDETFPVCEDYEFWLRVTARYSLGLLKEELVIKNGGRKDELSSQYRMKDLYRIRAIRKLLSQKTLTEEQRALAREALREKCGIIQRGAYKRKRWGRFLKYAFLPLLS